MTALSVTVTDAVMLSGENGSVIATVHWLPSGFAPMVITFPPRLISAEVTPSSSSVFFISSEIYPFATAPKFSVTASLAKERDWLSA